MRVADLCPHPWLSAVWRSLAWLSGHCCQLARVCPHCERVRWEGELCPLYLDRRTMIYMYLLYIGYSSLDSSWSCVTWCTPPWFDLPPTDSWIKILKKLRAYCTQLGWLIYWQALSSTCISMQIISVFQLFYFISIYFVMRKPNAQRLQAGLVLALRLKFKMTLLRAFGFWESPVMLPSQNQEKITCCKPPKP